MSFDEEPVSRYLILHDESDSLFETWDGSLVAKCLHEDGCTDVTNIPKYEELFKQQKGEKV
jgi:hypothetical protein